MESVIGTYHDGRVDLGGAVDWPDGTAVAVNRRVTAVGMTEEMWPRTPEGIEELIREWDALLPLEFAADCDPAVRKIQDGRGGV